MIGPRDDGFPGPAVALDGPDRTDQGVVNVPTLRVGVKVGVESQVWFRVSKRHASDQGRPVERGTGDGTMMVVAVVVTVKTNMAQSITYPGIVVWFQLVARDLQSPISP